MNGKRGQFYLVAAIVIVAVIIGLAGVSNYAKQKPKVTVYDLSAELGVESDEVVQYGVFNYGGEEGLLGFLGNFTQLYTQYAGEGKDLYFIYGNKDNVTIIKYEDVVSGDVSVGTSKYQVRGKIVREDWQIPTENKINVTIEGGVSHQFVLTEGENFYYLLAEEVGDEKHIISSQE